MVSLLVTLVLSCSVLGSGSIIISVTFRRFGWTPEVGPVFGSGFALLLKTVAQWGCGGCSLASQQQMSVSYFAVLYELSVRHDKPMFLF